MTYRIKPGDTLSALALKYNTSVDALMKANPQIKDADLIYAGATMNLPGAKDGFDSAPGRSGPNLAGGRPGSTNGAAPPDSGDGVKGPLGNPYDIARSHLGKNAGSLKLEGSGVGKDMEDWVPNNVNCANFVSACLEQAGMISNGQHDNSVMGLMRKLDADPQFKRVSLKDAKPGDVVSMKVGSGEHVVMFAGWENGRPKFIGSNNVNPDGSQRISYSSMNYPIMAIHQYRG